MAERNSQRFTKDIRVRLTPEQYDELQATALREDRDLGTMGRILIVEALKVRVGK